MKFLKNTIVGFLMLCCTMPIFGRVTRSVCLEKDDQKIFLLHDVHSVGFFSAADECLKSPKQIKDIKLYAKLNNILILIEGLDYTPEKDDCNDMWNVQIECAKEKIDMVNIDVRPSATKQLNEKLSKEELTKEFLNSVNRVYSWYEKNKVFFKIFIEKIEFEKNFIFDQFLESIDKGRFKKNLLNKKIETVDRFSKEVFLLQINSVFVLFPEIEAALKIKSSKNKKIIAFIGEDHAENLETFLIKDGWKIKKIKEEKIIVKDENKAQSINKEHLDLELFFRACDRACSKKYKKLCETYEAMEKKNRDKVRELKFLEEQEQEKKVPLNKKTTIGSWIKNIALGVWPWGKSKK
ncbi:hypothetical protein KAH94_03200 [bacterium]|nr:hypothetical protein [bacterium]